MGHKGPVLRPRCIGPGRARTQIPFNSIPQSSWTAQTLNIMSANFSDQSEKFTNWHPVIQ